MKLHLSIGIPGSGKSTISKKSILPFLRASGETVVYISSDDIREEVTGDAGDISKDSIVWCLLYDRVLAAFKNNVSVYVDACHCDERSRRRYFDFLGKNGFRSDEYSVVYYHIDTPLEVCLHRNRTRARFVPEKVIEGMRKNLDVPYGSLVFRNA